MKPSVYWSACLLLVLIASPLSASYWRIRIEETTGIERRENEVTSVPLAAVGGATGGYRVIDPRGKEVAWQVSDGRLYFPVSVMPGTTPKYSVTCCSHDKGAFDNPITVRRTGMNRVELANSRFRLVMDLARAAFVEAYHLGAGPQRSLNLVDLTPGKPDPNDIHGEEKRPDGPRSSVTGDARGWTSLGGNSPITGVEMLDTGPLIARVRLRRGGDTWEIMFAANSSWLRWRAKGGFRFASISALPYLPFDRCADVSEYRWPTGPGGGEPPDNRIAERSWQRPPDGQFVYYRKDEDYGALGFVVLDKSLEFRGGCTSLIEARSASAETEIALTFPRWTGDATLLEARREARKLLRPVALEVETVKGDGPAPREPLARVERQQVRAVTALPAEWKPESLPLDGEWELAWGEPGQPPSSEWRKVRVPGTAHVQWLPESQLFTREASWVSTKVWWYRRKVQTPSTWTGRTARLQFDSTDYYADVYLDGQRIGRHEGYIDPWEIDATSYIRSGREQELMVRVWTPVHYYWKHRPYTIKGAYGAVDQKPDDITALGITRSVRLVAGEASWLKDLSVTTRLPDKPGGPAVVELSLEPGGAPQDGLHWQVTLSPRSFQGGQTLQASVQGSSSPATLSISVEDARLWHTWDVGEPNLYTLDVRLIGEVGNVLDGRRIAVGIREIERVGDQFFLNRRKLFLRGTNTYFHLFMSEMDRAKYERDFKIIRGMNVNALRLHCHFDNQEIYDLADEQGVLIWQDFLEAWYPRDREFSLHASSLYDNHIRYVRNHPSVMAWAPSDEEDHVNYNDLSKHLAARAALLDPQMRWVQRSTGRYGDSHLYFGWYGGSVWQYAKMTEPLVTELGAPSFPNRESLDKFLGGKWPMLDYADDWRYRRLQIEEAIQNIGDPRKISLDEYIRQSQDYTSRLFQIALERARRNKATGAGGIFHFFAIDIWPSVTMAAVDFYRQPMKVYKTVQRSFQPVVASAVYTQDTWKAGEKAVWPLWLVNDTWEDYAAARVDWQVIDSKGKIKAEGRSPTIAAKADSAFEIAQASWTTDTGPYTLRLQTWAGDTKLSENVVEFRVEP